MKMLHVCYYQQFIVECVVGAHGTGWRHACMQLGASLGVHALYEFVTFHCHF